MVGGGRQRPERRIPRALIRAGVAGRSVGYTTFFLGFSSVEGGTKQTLTLP
jgi:hypothetical protein